MVSSFSLDKKKTILIAEACDNHFGSLNNAKRMVLQAKKAGADVIKFQHHIPDEEMLKKVPKSGYFFVFPSVSRLKKKKKKNGLPAP